MEKNKIPFLGKYADQRKDILENHAPGVYSRMLAAGTLEEHLSRVQDCVSDYVERVIDLYRMSDEYLDAEEKDPFEAMRLLNMTVLEAENAAYRIWIGDIPDDDYNGEVFTVPEAYSGEELDIVTAFVLNGKNVCIVDINKPGGRTVYFSHDDSSPGDMTEPKQPAIFFTHIPNKNKKTENEGSEKDSR